jgi:anti-sigma regulatory factor (Ser/Thr protein kinase)
MPVCPQDARDVRIAARRACVRAEALSVRAARLSLVALNLQRRQGEPWSRARVSGGMGPVLVGGAGAAGAGGVRRRQFDTCHEQVRAVRAFVGAAAAEARVEPDRAVLAASELAANAVLHARTPFTVTLCVVPGRLRVEFADGSEIVPEPPLSLDPYSATGRGLKIVAAVTDAWGVEDVPGGKVVWFEISASAG